MFQIRKILTITNKNIKINNLIKIIPLNLNNNLILKRSFAEKKITTKQTPAHIVLSEVLQNEIMHEQTNYEIDEDYEDIKTKISKLFKITDKPGYGNITLERTYKGEHITVSFDCQDTVDDLQDEELYEKFNEQQNGEEAEYEDPNGEDGDDELPPNKFGINFEVTVKKENSKAIFFCTSSEDRVVIQNITFVPEGVEDAKAYSGPKYEDLDASLRDAFQLYLSERRIDDDLAFYILSEARNKEEREYRGWLTNLAEFYAR